MTNGVSAHGGTKADFDLASGRIPPGEISEAAAGILRSSSFSGSERMQQLFSYIMARFLEDDRGALKETSIGVEVFGRDPGYDPKIDSIVRTEVRRLRALLRDYYESEGAGAALIIQVPKGGYTPELIRRPSQPSPAMAPVARPATAAVASTAPSRAWPSRGLLFLLAGSVLAAALGAALLRSVWQTAGSAPPAEAPAIRRVVVLPFQGSVDDPENPSYGRRIANTIIARLGPIEGLSVVASSGARWIDTEHDEDWEIARRLNADYIVTGAFTKDSERASAWVRLTEARGRAVLTARQFDFPWADLERVEQEMGSAVEEGLSSASKDDSPGTDSRVSQEAREAFLQGYYSSINFRQTFQVETFRAANRFLQRALELEPNYPDALATLILNKLSILYPWGPESAGSLDEAEQLSRLALDREPRHALTLTAASSVALYRGRLGDALDYAQQARDANPRHPTVLNQLAEVYEAAGFYEASAEVYARCIGLNPVIMDPYVFGALPLVRLGKYAESMDRVRLFSAFDPSSIHVVGIEAYALTREGKAAAAEALLLKTRNSLAGRFAGDPALAFRYSYLDYALALAQVRQGREDFGREVVSRLGAVSQRSLDDVILLTAALGLPKAAIENIETNPFYRNYRYMISEPGLEPLYEEPEFRNLLSQTYSAWNHLLADYGDTLPVRPPTLPSPDEFVMPRVSQTSAQNTSSKARVATRVALHQSE